MLNGMVPVSEFEYKEYLIASEINLIVYSRQILPLYG